MPPDLKAFVLHFLKNRDPSANSVDLQPIPADGSKRLFRRITPSTPGPSFIAMSNPPIDSESRRENFAYVMIGKHLHSKGIAVPEIYLHDLQRGWFIMEDMGHTSLQDLISTSEDPLPIYEKVLRHLFELQIEGAKGFDTQWCCQTKRYDRVVMRRYEADYFRDAFLCRYLGHDKKWTELEGPFSHLCETASRAEGDFFIHRDFQSRNLMVSGGRLGIVDWQGGRLGPLGYDLASLIIDPYVRLSFQQRDEIYERYLLLIKGHHAGWIESFKRYFHYLAIQRNLQILGAFSYLTKVKKKPYFETYIPGALRSLHYLLQKVNDRQLSPLKHLVNALQPQMKSLDIDGSGR